jgi:hypothetical protein
MSKEMTSNAIFANYCRRLVHRRTAMSRSFMLSLTVLAALALVTPLLAQGNEDIALGGGLVARLRDPGAYATVRERAAKVNQKLCDVVSTKDTQHPQVTVKQKGHLWTVYAWDIAVLPVYPGEAEANGVSEKELAQRWAKNLTRLLPKATPCSKLPPEQLGYKPKGKTAPATAAADDASGGSVTAKTVAVKPTAAQPPVRVAKPKTAPVRVAATAPVAVKVAAPKLLGNESGAMLLIVDSMRRAREMNDQDWAAKKEGLARNLYNDLSLYLTGQGAPVRLGVAKPAPKAVYAKPVAAKPPKTAVAKPVKPLANASKPLPKPKTAAAKAANASQAKVPQKNRIRAKFEAAKAPFDKLQASDPQAAAQVSATLAASRQAFAYGNFDESERQIDAALSALGVEFKE